MDELIGNTDGFADSGYRNLLVRWRLADELA
jgi:hypothetical protein